jgi:hypothetical protein
VTPIPLFPQAAKTVSTRAKRAKLISWRMVV